MQNQVLSIGNLTAQTYLNISNSSVVGYVFEDLQGNKIFKNIEQTYRETIDRAILTVSQGKKDFYSEMRDTLKQLGKSGLVQYESGRARRLDSAVRQNMLEGIRQLNIETSRRFGEEYGADGVEISVHEAPAPDHADIQGRQFTDEEYQILQWGGKAKDINGVEYDGAEKRHIGELNCYHKTFNIVIGVSKPEYTEEQLKKILEDNKKGFDFEGKHYSLYEGTQLQRRIETEIRRQKDTQILAKASGDKTLVGESQNKITLLNKKYNNLCNTSGLKAKKQRLNVIGYKRIDINKI